MHPLHDNKHCCGACCALTCYLTSKPSSLMVQVMMAHKLTAQPCFTNGHLTNMVQTCMFKTEDGPPTACAKDTIVATTQRSLSTYKSRLSQVKCRIISLCSSIHFDQEKPSHYPHPQYSTIMIRQPTYSSTAGDGKDHSLLERICTLTPVPCKLKHHMAVPHKAEANQPADVSRKGKLEQRLLTS